MIENSRYQELIEQESRHWGEVSQDPHNPQIWHDPKLFEIFFEKEYRCLVEKAVACGPNVLELGCGEGNLSLELASRGMRVTGIDLSPQRIERAKAKAQKALFNDPPTFLLGDLNTICLTPAAFDCVVAHDSLHHIALLGKLCEEVKKSLKPGGHFIVMDYVGMGPIRKILGGALYGILPTYQSYRAKWGFRKRLPAFLASERQKRKSLEAPLTHALHSESPFEEISQGSIVREITARFRINEQESFCPFWFYLVAKVRMPKMAKYPVARFLRSFDNVLVRFRISKGAYVWIVAENSPKAE